MSKTLQAVLIAACAVAVGAVALGGALVFAPAGQPDRSPSAAPQRVHVGSGSAARQSQPASAVPDEPCDAAATPQLRADTDRDRVFAPQTAIDYGLADQILTDRS